MCSNTSLYPMYVHLTIAIIFHSTNRPMCADFVNHYQRIRRVNKVWCRTILVNQIRLADWPTPPATEWAQWTEHVAAYKQKWNEERRTDKIIIDPTAYRYGFPNVDGSFIIGLIAASKWKQSFLRRFLPADDIGRTIATFLTNNSIQRPANSLPQLSTLCLSANGEMCRFQVRNKKSCNSFMYNDGPALMGFSLLSPGSRCILSRIIFTAECIDSARLKICYLVERFLI